MILVLAGTAEARELCTALGSLGIDAVASLAGATRAPAPLGISTRAGGFGGEDAFIEYLNINKISAVIDVTHPFAHKITERSARVCSNLGIPYLRVERPAWKPRPHERWHAVVDAAEAVARIPPQKRVFLAIGRQHLDDFNGLKSQHVFARMIDKPSVQFPFEHGDFVVGRPPFDLASEKALFSELTIEWLVAKNAGGAGRAKLDAAQALGINVIIIDRPKLDPVPTVSTPAEALAWIKSL